MDKDTEASDLMRRDESNLLVQIIRDFSTWEPFPQVLRRQLNLIGFFLRTWLGAEKGLHFFTNPNISCVHWMLIGKDETRIPSHFRQESLNIVPLDDLLEVKGQELKALCEIAFGHDHGYRCVFVPFSQRDFPLGHFILAFSGEPPSRILRQKIKGTLNVLQNHLRDVFHNHYPITTFTYLPSFLSSTTTEVALLFCDIRNSTRVLEVARMATDEKYTEMIILLLKKLLEYASRVISVPNIGRIHRFLGDGFLATFGEHLTVEATRKARAASALGLLTGKLLVEGFDKLWSLVQQHPLNDEYLGAYNEDMELRLGVGLNYGQVRFDHFGIAMADPEYGETPKGFCEFMAVGDHVNLARRVCSLASQPVSSLDIAFRSTDIPPSRLSSPIVASRTITFWSRDCFKHEGDPLVMCRIDVQHKGKGHSVPSFELLPDSLDTFRLLKSLEGLHDNHFHDAIEKEVAQEVDDRPQLRQVVRSFQQNLDKIHQRYILSEAERAG